MRADECKHEIQDYAERPPSYIRRLTTFQPSQTFEVCNRRQDRNDLAYDNQASPKCAAV